jgi:hypothetical protein
MTTSSRGRLAVGLSVGAAILAIPGSAAAFGTVDFNGQHAEHEKITRVLSCDAVDHPARCFAPRSLDELAGKKGTLGAVGSPDRIPDVLLDGAAHCDGGDYLPGFPYRPSDAERAARNLDACADEFERHLNEALSAAGDLTDHDGRLIPSEANLSKGDSEDGCSFPMLPARPAEQSAKCRVYNGLGRALHAAEDYWSHSNWADEANPGQPTILPPGTSQTVGAGWRKETIKPPNAVDPVYSLTNPVGLGRSRLVPFLRYPVPKNAMPTAASIRDGQVAITGCDDSLEEVSKVLPPGECKGRVGHSSLNKDKGLINWRTGQTSDPETPRGKIGDNFQRAVTGARAQAKAVWDDFADQIVARYGERRGSTMIRALTTDTPWTECTVGDSRGNWKAFTAPSGARSALRSVTARVVNETRAPLGCAEVTLTSGEWASLPHDEVTAGRSGTFRTESTVLVGGRTGGPEGSVSYRLRDTAYGVRFTWDNPIVGSNRFSCQVTRNGAPDGSAPYRCAVDKQRGDDATPDFMVVSR